MLHCDEGTVLVEEETLDNTSLFVVLSGSVSVSQRTSDGPDAAAKEMHKAYPGGMLGQLQVLTSEPSFFTYTAVQPCRVAALSGEGVRRLMSRHPHVALALAVSVIENLSAHVR